MSRTLLSAVLAVGVASAALLVAKPSIAAEIPKGWHTDVASAQAEAAANHRPITVFFTADWCHYCRRMEQETLSDVMVIENRLHWQFDVTFQEDQCRIRHGHVDANFSILRRTALSLLKNESTLKVGVKNKRLTAGWDDEYLEKALFG